MSDFFRRRIFKPSFGKIALATTLVGLGLGGALAYGAYRLLEREFPDVAVLNSKYPQTLYLGPNQPVKIKLVSSPPPGWVRLNQIAKPAMGAVVVSEDWAFFSHEGFDANQLKEAIKEDIADRKFSRGASTITMQVVKNVFLSHEKTLYRKAKEFVLAIRLDRNVSKRKVLEVYFNIAEWGQGIYGIGAASRHYFGKHPSELTPREGAFLAMLLPSPKRYSQSFRSRQLTPYASKTIRSILGKMARAQYITEDDRDLALSSRMSFEAPALESPPSSPFSDESVFEEEENTEESTGDFPTEETSERESPAEAEPAPLDLGDSEG